MNAAEHELIARFHDLDPAARERVRARIAADPVQPAFDFDAWVAAVEAIRADVATHCEEDRPPLDGSALLRALHIDADL